MGLIATVTGYAAPVFLVISPVLSYTDQAISMYRAKSSAGFSLDIPLIMLVASICRSVLRPSLEISPGRKTLTFAPTGFSTIPALDTIPPCSYKHSAISWSNWCC